MKFWSSSFVFDHPWESISTAFWRKYPNPLNPAVVATDVIERCVCDDGTLSSQRLIRTDFSLPSWIKRLMGTEACYVSEESVVNAAQKTMVMTSKNVTFNSLLTIEEHITYSPVPGDPTKTRMTQEAKITVGSSFHGVSFLENQVLKSIESNASKGRQALEMVTNIVEDEIKELANMARKNLQQASVEFSEAAQKLSRELPAAKPDFESL